MKLFSILSSLLFLLPTRTAIHACAFFPEKEELRYMLFNPDLLHNKSWWSFFYNAKTNYLDGNTFSADDETVLAEEWIRQMKITANVHDVLNCLFGDLPDSALQQNSFFKAISKQSAAKQYFDIARQCEQLASLPAPWEEDDQKNQEKTEERRDAIASIQRILQNEEDDFLRKKYAFQLVKLAYYANDTSVFNKVYNEYFQHAEKLVLDWWAMHYKSMMLERMDKMDSANYLHALVFSHSSNKMFVSKQYFSKKNLEGIVTLAQNDTERADIYLLSEVINPGRSLEGIRKVYQYTPAHKHLPLLISRELNKLEDWLASTKYAGMFPVVTDTWEDDGSVMSNWQRDYEYLKEFINALKEMPVLAKTYPVFYNLSMTYLCLMKGDTAAASTYLSLVQSGDPEILYQRRVLLLLLTVQQKDITTAAVQDEIGALYQSLLQDRAQKFESQKMLYSLSSYLRYTYANKGLIYLAGLFDNYATNKFCYTCDVSTFEYSMIRYFDENAAVSDIQKLIEVYNRPVKNKLEEVLLKPYSNKHYLYDLLSVKYLRRGDVKNAMITLQKIPAEFWFSFSNAAFYLDRDPFHDNSELLSIQTMETYNKREIVEKMVNLEQEASINSGKRAENYFLLGNAWYNFSDNSWFMISYGCSEGTTDNPADADNAKKKALAYYQKALQYEEQTENKVKLVYMIALLDETAKKKEYAIRYEQYHNTLFYTKRNCLTLADLARAN